LRTTARSLGHSGQKNHSLSFSLSGSRPAVAERECALEHIAGDFLATGLVLYFLGVWFLPAWLPTFGAISAGTGKPVRLGSLE
jgi:hypothetical protein